MKALHDGFALFLSSLIGKKWGALEALTYPKEKTWKSIPVTLCVYVKFMLSRKNLFARSTIYFALSWMIIIAYL